jgi:hypothetical protein
MSNNKYSDEARAEILASARETIRRTEHIAAADPFTRNIPSAADRWRAEQSEKLADDERQKRKADLRIIERALERRVSMRVLGAVQTMINNSIGTARKEHVEQFLPELIAALRSEISEELCGAIEQAYKASHAELLDEVAALRRAVRKINGDDTVLDLPALRTVKAH